MTSANTRIAEKAVADPFLALPRRLVLGCFEWLAVSHGTLIPRRNRPCLSLETPLILGDRSMRFTKMHGIGNDYVYVSTFDQKPPADPGSWPWRSAIAISGSAATA